MNDVVKWAADAPWQPIETAPKNWRIIGATANGKIYLFSWDTDQYAKNPKPFWNTDFPFGKGLIRAMQPVKWLPVPTTELLAGNDGNA